MSDPYKTLQSILEKVHERSEAARYAKGPDAIYHAILSNQERLAEALLVLGSVLQVIVDEQLVVKIKAPPARERN